MAIQMKKITLLKGFEFISEEPCVKTAAEEKLENFPIYNVRLNEDYQVCPYNCDGCSRQLQNGAEKLYTCSKSTKKYVLDFDDSIINVDNETLKINWEECVHYLKFDYMRYECKKTRKRLPSQWAAIGDEHVLYTYRFTAMMAFFGLEESAEYISAKLGVNVKTVKRYLYESIDQCDMDAYYDEIDTLVICRVKNWYKNSDLILFIDYYGFKIVEVMERADKTEIEHFVNTSGICPNTVKIDHDDEELIEIAYNFFPKAAIDLSGRFTDYQNLDFLAELRAIFFEIRKGLDNIQKKPREWFKQSAYIMTQIKEETQYIVLSSYEEYLLNALDRIRLRSHDRNLYETDKDIKNNRPFKLLRAAILYGQANSEYAYVVADGFYKTKSYIYTLSALLNEINKFFENYDNIHRYSKTATH